MINLVGDGTYGLVYLAHNQVQEPRPGTPGPQLGTETYGLFNLYNQVQEPTAWST